MNAISSHKPFHKSAEVAQNQICAHQSWNIVFSRIIYLGNHEPELASPKTEFLPRDTVPTIREMAELASTLQDWSALVNADIVVDSRLFYVEHKLKAMRAECAMSRRWEFDPATMNFHAATIKDLGLDFFCASPAIWRRVAVEIPDEFLIGHILFDTWLLSFFMQIAPRYCYDLSPCRLVFHPKHEHRDDQSTPADVGRDVIARIRWPMLFTIQV